MQTMEEECGGSDGGRDGGDDGGDGSGRGGGCDGNSGGEKGGAWGGEGGVGGEGGHEGGGESAARMKTRETGPSLRLQVSFVPTTVGASGLCESQVFARGSAWSDEARVANVGAMKKAASRSSAGSR